MLTLQILFLFPATLTHKTKISNPLKGSAAKEHYRRNQDTMEINRKVITKHLNTNLGLWVLMVNCHASVDATNRVYGIFFL